MLAQYPTLRTSEPGKVIKKYNHEPNVNPTISPISQGLRSVPLALEEKVIAKLKEMEADGILQRVDSSPWVSNMVVVPKSNADIRICVDLRLVKKDIIPDKYPLPTEEELSKFFSGSTVFSKIDLKWGYRQVPLNENSYVSQQ